LAGLRVLITRPASAIAPWQAALERAGATVIAHPTTVVTAPPSWAPLDAAFAQLADYDWLVFTSANAVALACDRLTSDVSPATLSRPEIAAVGDETARALSERGFRVAFVPDDKRQEGLVAGLSARLAGVASPRVLFPRALDGREHLVEALAARGIAVDVVPASQTRAITDLQPPPHFDVATFASPSALSAYAARLGTGTISAVPCVVIGATTAAAARALGLVPIQAAAPNIESVIEAIATAAGVVPPNR
jgi:uroporphyrinogen-III synthase